MKSFAAALAVLSVAAFCYQVSSSPSGVHFSSPCCVRYRTREISREHVKAYEYTSSVCSQPGVIFTTINGLVCVSPEDKWVQDIIKHLNPQADNETTTL